MKITKLKMVLDLLGKNKKDISSSPIYINNIDSVNLNKIVFLFFIDLFLIQSYIPDSGVYFSYNGVSWYISSL